jgi:hypothetical protein
MTKVYGLQKRGHWKKRIELEEIVGHRELLARTKVTELE